MQLHIHTTALQTIEALADFFIKTANAAIQEKGICRIVLSGGNSPKELYELLASAAYRKKTDWSKCWFFFGDERYVTFNDPASNGLMAKHALFEPLKIAADNIFYIDTMLPPAEAAADYSESITAHFKDEPAQFDLILLGLGDNAHTASLFPHSTVLKETQALVSAVYVEEQKTYRITFTASLINQAYAIAFLVYGPSKARAVFQVLKGERDVETYPAQLIESVNGNVHWFLDEDAAALVNKTIPE